MSKHSRELNEIRNAILTGRIKPMNFSQVRDLPAGYGTDDRLTEILSRIPITTTKGASK